MSGALLFILGIAFIVLKLAGVIAWSWWLVTMPLWVGAAISFSFFVLVLGVVLAAVISGNK